VAFVEDAVAEIDAGRYARRFAISDEKLSDGWKSRAAVVVSSLVLGF